MGAQGSLFRPVNDILCSTCGNRLSRWYLEKAGSLYCRKDYWRKLGHLCQGCSLPITGPVMVAGVHRYHPECFQCGQCGSCIGDGDCYALLERTFLYCGQCYRHSYTSNRPNSLPLPDAPSPKTETLPRRPHSIQMVELSPSPDKPPGVDNGQQKLQRPLQLSILDSGPRDEPISQRNSLTSIDEGKMGPYMHISYIEESPHLSGLELGDRILEVDGSQIKDKSVDEVCSLILANEKPVHVMLERDLSPLRAPEEVEPVTSPPEEFEGRTIMVHDTPVKLRPKASLKAHGYSASRRRSKSPSPCPSGRQRSMDLSRSHSFSSHNLDQRLFRPSDLVEGKVLGQGFFGQAIQAKHKITGEFMVLKELHNFDETAEKGFLREVSMLRNLSHPCVLKFLGVLYRDKKLTLVTEFIDGGTLTQLLLDKTVELSWVERVRMAKDIADGMRYLHSMDIIHRDLNSENCLVRKDRTVVVADFGLAKIVPRYEFMKALQNTKEERPSKEREKTGKKKRFSRRKRHTVVGNPFWMAPEMLSFGIYDEKVDVFSYGMIVCETIARVTANPDYLPRSTDFGLNAKAFHRRFCVDCPEPYFMLGFLCSHLEPDRRPSFEKAYVLCEALLLHLEHGMTAPQELQGSTVEHYHALKERLYGKNYMDVDSVMDANTEENAEVLEEQRSGEQQSSLSDSAKTKDDEQASKPLAGTFKVNDKPTQDKVCATQLTPGVDSQTVQFWLQNEITCDDSAICPKCKNCANCSSPSTSPSHCQSSTMDCPSCKTSASNSTYTINEEPDLSQNHLLPDRRSAIDSHLAACSTESTLTPPQASIASQDKNIKGSCETVPTLDHSSSINNHDSHNTKEGTSGQIQKATLPSESVHNEHSFAWKQSDPSLFLSTESAEQSTRASLSLISSAKSETDLKSAAMAGLTDSMYGNLFQSLSVSPISHGQMSSSRRRLKRASRHASSSDLSPHPSS